METEQFKDNELKLIELIKKNRELENTISDLNHELELVKARVMTQEKRRIEKDNKIRERALIESQKRILRQADEEAYLKSLGK